MESIVQKRTAEGGFTMMLIVANVKLQSQTFICTGDVLLNLNRGTIVSRQHSRITGNNKLWSKIIADTFQKEILITVENTAKN